MKTVRLALIKSGETTGAEIHGNAFGFDPHPDGTTYVCGGCGKPILEGFKPGFIEMVGVDLVCQHCGLHNYLDTNASA